MPGRECALREDRLRRRCREMTTGDFISPEEIYEFPFWRKILLENAIIFFLILSRKGDRWRTKAKTKKERKKINKAESIRSGRGVHDDPEVSYPCPLCCPHLSRPYSKSPASLWDSPPQSTAGRFIDRTYKPHCPSLAHYSHRRSLFVKTHAHILLLDRIFREGPACFFAAALSSSSPASPTPNPGPASCLRVTSSCVFAEKTTDWRKRGKVSKEKVNQSKV